MREESGGKKEKDEVSERQGMRETENEGGTRARVWKKGRWRKKG